MKCISLFFQCCWPLVVVVGQLQPVVESDMENQYILRVVSSLDELFYYKNLITFSEKRVLANSSSVGVSLEQVLMERFGRAIFVAGYQMNSFESFITERDLAVVIFYGLDDPMISAVTRTLSYRKTITTIFVYNPRNGLSPTTALIETVFTWYWQAGFRYGLLIVKRQNGYETWTYQIKPQFKIFKYSDWMQTDTVLSHLLKFRDMEKCRTSVALFHNPPDAFVFNSSEQRDLTGNNVSLGGMLGVLTAEFMRYSNGRMDLVLMSADEYYKKATQPLTKDLSFDVGVNWVSNSKLNLYSAVRAKMKMCLVVPVNRRVPNSQVLYILCQHWSLMVLFTILFCINAVIKYLSNPCMPLCTLLYKTLFHTYAVPVSPIDFHLMRLPEKFSLVWAQLYSVLLVGLFCSALTSAITVGLYYPKIVDVNSFLSSGLRIMVYESQINENLGTNQLDRALTNRFLFVNESVRNEHLNSLDNSHAYLLESYKWVQMEFMQSRLHQPKFQLAPEKLCGVTCDLRVPVRPELSNLFSLDWFMSNIDEAGLLDKWIQSGLEQAQLAGMISQAPYKPHTRDPLKLEFFEYPFTFYAVGILLSLLVFILECGIAKWRSNRNLRNALINI